MGRTEPAQRPAQDDDPGPVAHLEVRGRQRRRAVHGQVQGPVRDGALGRAERVDHDDQVGRPGRGPLVHVQLAAADADGPVHVPQLIAGLVGAQAGELDARADGPAGVLADPAQQLGRDQPGAHPGRPGEDLQRIGFGPDQHLGAAQPGPGGHQDRAGRIPAPPGRPDHPGRGDRPGLQENLRRSPGDQRDPRRGHQLGDDLVQRGAAGHADGGGDGHVLALEAARPRHCHGHVRLRRPPPGHQRQRPQGRRGQQDQGGVPGQDRGEQREQRRGGQVPGSRRGMPACHGALRGTGTVARTSTVMSSPVTCRTHISGRSTSRWASAGTATALMSSGVT